MRMVGYTVKPVSLCVVNEILNLLKSLGFPCKKIRLDATTPYIEGEFNLSEFKEIKIDWDGQILISIGENNNKVEIYFEIYSRLNAAIVSKDFVCNKIYIIDPGELLCPINFGKINGIFKSWIGYYGEVPKIEELSKKYGGIYFGLARPEKMTYFSSELSKLDFRKIPVESLLAFPEGRVLLSHSESEVETNIKNMGMNFFRSKAGPSIGKVEHLGFVSGLAKILFATTIRNSRSDAKIVLKPYIP